MNIEHLHYLIVAADCGNLTNAAKQLNITQSALTQSINTLENIYGADLFVRGSRGIHLTPFGSLLVPRARLIVNEQVKLLSDAAVLNASDFPRITIGVAPYLSNRVFQHAVDDLIKQTPELSVHIVLAETLELAEMLRKGEIEFAFCGKLANDPPFDGLEFDEVMTRPHLLMARASHPLFEQTELIGLALLDYRWVVYDLDIVRAAILNICPSPGQELPRRLVTTNSLSMMCALTLNTNTLAFLPADYMAQELECGAIRVIEIPKNRLSVTSGFLSHRDHPLSRHIDCLRDNLARMCLALETNKVENGDS